VSTVGTVIVLSIVAVGAIISRSIAQNLDRQRIRDDVEKRGNEVLEIVWKRFGKGWLGSTNQRIYDVTFKTGSGKTMTATCKTNMFGGVFWASNVLPADSEDVVKEDRSQT
jgi:hypothetical protein